MPVQHLHDLKDAPFPGQDSCLIYSAIRALLTELKGHPPPPQALCRRHLELWGNKPLENTFTKVAIHIHLCDKERPLTFYSPVSGITQYVLNE